jgi:hypothetical protein
MSFAGPFILCMVLRCGGAPTLDAAQPREMFPGVHVNLAAKTVDFDARITPMLVKDERAPLFYLEVLACSPNTREHETIIVSDVKPSHIHAALLLVGLNPGEPGKWTLKDNTLVASPPTGDRVSVRIIYTDKDGKTIEANPLDWITSTTKKTAFLDSERATAKAANLPAPGWVFAGSRIVKSRTAAPNAPDAPEVYDADGSGTIIGLTTFGSEVIAWSRVISPDANIAEPEWIADFTKTPPPDTKVRVQIRKAD